MRYMTVSATVSLIAIISGVVVATFTTSSSEHSSAYEGEAIRLDAGTLLPGEEREVEFNLTNCWKSEWLIDGIQASCGCLGYSTNTGEALKLPLTLSGAATQPMKVKISTKGRLGRQQHSLTINGHLGTHKAIRNILISMNIEKHLYADPSELWLLDATPEVAIEKDVFIYDTQLKEHQLLLDNITVSNNERLHVSVEALSRKRADTNSETPTNHRGVPIYKVKVAYSPGSDSWKEEFVRLSSKVRPDISIDLPIICRTTVAELALKPSKIVFSSRAGHKNDERVVWCLCREPKEEPTIRQLPAGIAVDFVPLGTKMEDSGRVFKMTVRLLDRAQLFAFDDRVQVDVMYCGTAHSLWLHNGVGHE
mgnify:CR=1 FL=1